MDLGDVAGLIAAGVFAVLVGFLAVPILKLGRVFDELRLTIRSVNDGTTPLIDEVTRTVATTNTQLEKVDGITSNVSDASANVSALSSLVASSVGQPFIKVAAFSHGIRRAFGTEQQGRPRPQDPGARQEPTGTPRPGPDHPGSADPAGQGATNARHASGGWDTTP